MMGLKRRQLLSSLVAEIHTETPRVVARRRHCRCPCPKCREAGRRYATKPLHAVAARSKIAAKHGDHKSGKPWRTLDAAERSCCDVCRRVSVWGVRTGARRVLHRRAEG